MKRLSLALWLLVVGCGGAEQDLVQGLPGGKGDGEANPSACSGAPAMKEKHIQILETMCPLPVKFYFPSHPNTELYAYREDPHLRAFHYGPGWPIQTDAEGAGELILEVGGCGGGACADMNWSMMNWSILVQDGQCPLVRVHFSVATQGTLSCARSRELAVVN